MISHPKLVAHILHAGVVVFFALGCVVLATSEGAADNTDSLRAFQKNKLPSQNEINASYTRFTYTPFDRKDLAFTIMIPNDDWRDIPISVNTETLQQENLQVIPVARQRAPDNEETKIEVYYTRFDLEMSLYDAMKMFLQKNKDYFVVLMEREGVYNQRKVEEVIVRSKQDANVYLVRMTFSRHGDRVFMVMGSALESEYTIYAEAFAAAAVSFKVKEKIASPYAEKMAVFTSTGTPRLQFNYPKAWTIEEVPGSAPGRVGVDLKWIMRGENKQSDMMYGYIHARAHAPQTGMTADQILAGLKNDFQEIPISFDRCTLRADMLPELEAPLGKLEKWTAVAGGVPGEAAFLVLPRQADFIGLGLFSTRSQDNLIAWMHAWRVFEIAAGDLSGKKLALAKLKSHHLPSSSELTQLVAGTMTDFARAAKKNDFHAFHADLSTKLQLQATPEKFRQAFRGFGQQNEIDALSQLDPVLEKEACLDADGLLKLSGRYSTRPQEATFRLTYAYEQDDWKLLRIHVSMKEPSESAKTSIPKAVAPDKSQRIGKINVLAAENGGQVVSCSSQYNSTSWGARNLIDGQLGSNHGYASRNREPAEIVFSLSKTETLSQLCFNPYTTESSQTWAQRVQVEVSTHGPNAGFQPVGEYPLHNQRSQNQQTPLPDQCFDIGEVQARYIKLRLLSNHGGGYIELGEFKAYAAAK